MNLNGTEMEEKIDSKDRDSNDRLNLRWADESCRWTDNAMGLTMEV